jgi:hypothetical protein
VPLPALRLDPRTGSSGRTIPVDLRLVSSVRLIGGVRLIGAAPGDVLDAQLVAHDHP